MFPFNSQPPNIYGYRASLQVHNPRFNIIQSKFFLDLSYANWNTTQSHISIIAIAPILRFSLYDAKLTTLFFDLSAGPSYLSKTIFDHRHQGIHYAFQLIAGPGLKIGKNKNTAISWKIMHYSNSRLSHHNAGITIPIVVSVSHLFKN
ncbi:acyloxyacyl hydrolase [Legionella brunensis]